MAKGYWMFHATVHDAEAYRGYVAHDAAAFAAFGARFLVRGGDFTAVEGTARERHVVIEFDSYAAALACWHSPEYQAAAARRQGAALVDLVIVEGVA